MFLNQKLNVVLFDVKMGGEFDQICIQIYTNFTSSNENLTPKKLSKRLDDIQGRTVPGANTICLLHFARDFNNHINKVSETSN